VSSTLYVGKDGLAFGDIGLELGLCHGREFVDKTKVAHFCGSIPNKKISIGIATVFDEPGVESARINCGTAEGVVVGRQGHGQAGHGTASRADGLGRGSQIGGSPLGITLLVKDPFARLVAAAASSAGGAGSAGGGGGAGARGALALGAGVATRAVALPRRAGVLPRRVRVPRIRRMPPRRVPTP